MNDLDDLDRRIAAAPQGSTVDDLSDLDRRIQRAGKPVAAQGSASSPLGSDWQNFWAATGKGLIGVAQGAKQLSDIPAQAMERAAYRNAPSWVSGFGESIGLPTAQQSAQMTQAQVDEAAIRDQPLMETKAGIAGNALGTTAGAALPLAVGAAAGVPYAASMLAPTGYGSAVAAGGLQGALQPTVTGGDTRGWNTLIGGGAGAAGNWAVNTLGRLVSPARDALSTAYQKAVNVLDQAGVPLDAAQRSGSVFLQKLRSSFSDNPFTAGAQAELTDTQKGAYTKAVLNTIGEDSTKADQQTMANAASRIDGVFRDVLSRNKVNVTDDVMNRIGAVQAAAVEEEKAPVARIASRFVDSVKADGAVPGQVAYNIKKDLDRLANSPDTTLAYHARQLRSTVMDAINDSLPAADQTAFSQARGQFSNLKRIEGVIQDGDISPAKLANVFNQKANRGVSVYGKGPQDLFDLAQAGKMLLPDKTPNSGTTSRLMATFGGTPALASMVVQKPAQMLMNNPATARMIGNYPGVTYGPLRDLLMMPQTNEAVGAITRRVPLAAIEAGMRSPPQEQ